MVSVLNSQYGKMEITDGTHSIPVYGVEGYSSMADKPYKGDTVLLLCVLQNYTGTKEVKSAELIEFEHVKVEVDESIKIDETDILHRQYTIAVQTNGGN